MNLREVHTDIGPTTTRYFLRQQIKVLQDEACFDGPDKEIESLRKRESKKKRSKAAAAHFSKRT